MSFWGDFNDLTSGQPLGTTDAGQAAGDAAEAQIKALNDQQLAAGEITPQEYAQMQQDFATSDAANVGNVSAQAQQAFDQSIQDTVSGVTKGVTGTVWDVIGSFLKSLPLWLWVVVAGALFVWLGGLELLRGSLKKYAK